MEHGWSAIALAALVVGLAVAGPTAQAAYNPFRVEAVAPSMVYPGQTVSMFFVVTYNGSTVADTNLVLLTAYVRSPQGSNVSTYSLPAPRPVGPGEFGVTWTVPAALPIGSVFWVEAEGEYLGFNYTGIAGVTVVQQSVLFPQQTNVSTPGGQVPPAVALPAFVITIAVTAALVFVVAKLRGKKERRIEPLIEEAAPFMVHAAELIHRFLVSLAATFVFFAFFFLFRPVWFRAGPLYLFYPYPDLFSSFSAQAFTSLREHILPPALQLININSFDTFMASIYMALALALIFAMPVWVYEMAGFVSPALKPEEKRLIRYVTVPATLLFAAGVAFAYEIILPVLFHFLYLFTVGISVLPTLSVKTFASTVFVYMLAFGLAFQLPIIVVGLSYLGVVSPVEWLKQWRFAVVGAFFIALLISPGASGGIMEITIGLTLSGLYVVGALVAMYLLRAKRPAVEDAG
ncbi:MAG: preprotein translocase subunit TatC [Nitrososphaerota archaeon]|nr:preprotein translocase subunit TatC [Nitrososphaerota archaeon]MDG6938778.1 preprotein translocase subunit TatC [Nitrososphaerota archaeon]